MSVQEPLVSILINNYNYENFLGQAIDSALSQTYENVEVVVVDDGSTDNSRDIILGYGGRVLPIFKENAGQASAFNAGFENCKGDLVCFLDSDDIFYPHKIKCVVEAFSQLNKEIGWYFHHLEMSNLDFQSEKLQCLDFQKNNFLLMPKDLQEVDFRKKIRKAVLPNFVPATSGLCFSRELLEKIIPIPVAESVYISDLYLKYVALALEKGCLINLELAIQRLHENNIYTSNKGKERIELDAAIDINTAYWMRHNFPFLSALTDKFMGRGLGKVAIIGEPRLNHTKVIDSYLKESSLLQKIRCYLNTLYYFLIKNLLLAAGNKNGLRL